jgi:hypothetical protein
MVKNRGDKPELFSQGDRHFITVDVAKADALREHLRSHNITTSSPEGSAGPYVSIELGGDVDPESVQAILDQWEE